MKKAQKDMLCSLLLEEKALIEQALEANRDATQTVTLDQQSVGRVSRIDALQQQQMALATERKNHQRLQMIEKTLHRIENDEDYGFCASCDEPIAMKRLELNPASTLCIQCAS